MSTQTTLPLADIQIDVSLQPRVAGLNADHVRALQETPDTWPPLLVVRRGGQCVLLDGFHRYAAAQNLGLENVPATVIPPPDDGDLATLAFAANLAHGMPLSLADKRTRAERLLTEQSDVSNMEIARQVALSPTTIAAIRERLEAASTIAPAGHRVGKGGYTYAVPADSRRALGDLPPVGIGAHIGALFTPAERRQQRAVAHYLQRLALALDDRLAVGGWDGPRAVADAVRLVLGDERAVALGERLGEATGQIYDVALALGYTEESTP